MEKSLRPRKFEVGLEGNILKRKLDGKHELINPLLSKIEAPEVRKNLRRKLKRIHY